MSGHLAILTRAGLTKARRAGRQIRYSMVPGVAVDLAGFLIGTGRHAVLYALMCRSDRPLRLARGEPFDPAGFPNAGGTGAHVGALQVTALLRRVGGSEGAGDYEANIVAELTGSYWVRLTDAVDVGAEKRSMLAALGDAHGTAAWRSSVASIRSGWPSQGRDGAGPLI